MFGSLLVIALAAAAPAAPATPSVTPASLVRADSDSTITGRVTDATTGAPVPGVAVHVLNSAAGAVAADDGRWTVALPPELRGRQLRLRFSRVGYAPHERSAEAGAVLDVSLVPSARSLEAVSVTALRGGAELPIARSTLSAAAIERRYDGQEVPFLLETTPSVTAYAEGGAYSNYSYLRLRGIDQTRINVTLDGVPLSEPEDQGVFFSNYPDFGNGIGSVQVQRGVGTSQWGAAGFAGVINFESTPLAGSRRGAEAQLSGGSFGTWRGSLEYTSGLMDNRTAVYARASTMGTDGYRYNSGSRGDAGWLSAGWFGARDLVKLTAFSGRTRNEMAYYASSLDEIRADPRSNPLHEADDYHTTLTSLSHAHAFGERSSLQTTAYYVDFGGAYDVRIDPDLWSFGLGSRLAGAFSTWSGRAGPLALSVGAHANTYRRDHYAAIHPDLEARLYDNYGRKNEGSAFTKATWDAGRLTLFGDVQARRATFRYHPSAGSGLGELATAWSFVNPKAGARWRLTSALDAYGSWGMNGREPTRADMFAGLDDLDTTTAPAVLPLTRVHPERVRDLEAGLALHRRALSAQLGAYAMEFRHEIAPIGQLTIMGTPLRKNVPASYRRGIELDLAWRATDRLEASANAALSRSRIRTWIDSSDAAAPRRVHDVEPLLTPSRLANASVSWRAARALRLTVDGRYVGRSYLTNTRDADLVLPAATTADAGAEWTLGRLGVLAQVRNLADVRAYRSGYAYAGTPYYYLQAPRNWFVTVKVGL